jgi:hypothetical protein
MVCKTFARPQVDASGLDDLATGIDPAQACLRDTQEGPTTHGLSRKEMVSRKSLSPFLILLFAFTPNIAHPKLNNDLHDAGAVSFCIVDAYALRGDWQPFLEPFYLRSTFATVEGVPLSGLILKVSAEKCCAALTSHLLFENPHMGAVIGGSNTDQSRNEEVNLRAQ